MNQPNAPNANVQLIQRAIFIQNDDDARFFRLYDGPKIAVLE